VYFCLSVRMFVCDQACYTGTSHLWEFHDNCNLQVQLGYYRDEVVRF